MRSMRRLGGLCVAAALVAGLAACGSKSSGGSNPGGGGTGGPPTGPTPTNRSPSITAINVSPAFGVSGLTTFTMTGSASDPDGDALTLRWTFGGNTATGGAATSTINGDGSISVQFTATDPAGASASDSRTVTLGTMTGTWVVTVPFCNASFSMTLSQTGGIVTGTFVMPVAFCAAVAGSTGRTDPAEPGTIDAAGNVQIRLKVGAFLDFYVRGTMDATGRTVRGGVFNSGFNGQPMTMTKQ